MTIMAGKRALEALESGQCGKSGCGLCLCSASGSKGKLRGDFVSAVPGISQRIKGKRRGQWRGYSASALSIGVENAYKAVMNPTEGTILTVARMAAEQAVRVSNETNDPVIVFEEIVKAAESARIRRRYASGAEKGGRGRRRGQGAFGRISGDAFCPERGSYDR